MDLSARQELNNGFGGALARSFEMVATPGVFAAMGYGLDHLLGLHLILTWTLGALALAGMFVRMYYGYETQMRRLESEAPWARKQS